MRSRHIIIALCLIVTACLAYAEDPPPQSMLDYFKGRLPATTPPAATDRLPIMQGNGAAIRMILLPDLRPAFKNMTTGWAQIKDKPASFPPAAHTQGIGTIDGLQDALDGKQPALGFTPVADTDPRMTDARTPLAHDQAASTITYNGTTVAAVLDQLSYVPISITSFTLSGSASNVTREIGSSYTITGNGLEWATNKAATSETVNSVARTSPYMPPSPVSTNQTYTLQVGDGTTTASSSRTVTFTHYRYWGVSAATSLTDIDIRGLNKEFSTSRTQSRTFTPSGQYIYIAYLATGGAATFTVNGFLDSSWVLVQREFVNASNHPAEFRIYRSAYPLTGTYVVVVS